LKKNTKLNYYILYFFVFVSMGGIEKAIAFFFGDFQNGSVYYGLFLSILAFVEMIMPVLVERVTSATNYKCVAITYFVIVIIIAAINTLCNSWVGVSLLIFIIICEARTVFNFSAGNEIIFSIADNEKGGFFARRDLFLYIGIAISLFLSGAISEKFSPKVAITFLAFMLIIPMVMIQFLKIEQKNVYFKSETKLFAQALKLLQHKEFLQLLIISVFSSIYFSCSAYIPFLALEIGLNYQEIMGAFAGITVVNAILALFIGDLSDKRNKKVFYIIDLASDIFPCIIFLISQNVSLFIIAIVLSSIKDVFAPSTFAYKYELIGNFNDDTSKVAIAVLESMTNVMTFFMPLFMGGVWVVIGKNIFIIAIFSISITVLTALFLPPYQSVKNQKVELK